MYKVSNPDIKYTVAAQVGENAQGLMVVGQYAVIRELGHGSFGTVYLVKHSMTGDMYALKEYHKASLRKRLQSTTMNCSPSGRGGGPMRPGRGGLFAARQRLLQQRSEEDADPFSLIKTELAISKKLQHPNLVRLYEALNDSEQDVLYLVIDLCEKGPVQIIDPGSATSEPLSPEDAHKYFTQALLALEYLHEHDIVHRDIKPDNMLLTSDDTLKISDFGESTTHDNNDNKVHGSSGTPAFMAPELSQSGCSVSGEAADIWSLGICLYSFTYGTLPFHGTSVIEVLDSVSAGELHFPDPANEQLNELLLRMLDPNPDSRITIAEIREHPWVTKNGSFALPSKESNCEHSVTAITQEDIDSVIQPIFDIMPIIMAVAKLRRFRRRIREKREREARERDALSEGLSAVTVQSDGSVQRSEDGQPDDSPAPNFRCITGYCEQLDVHNPHATVCEALRFSAYLCQSAHVPDSEKNEYVKCVIFLLGLTDIANCLVGEPETSKGISLEEHKHLTISLELMSKPKILFLNEPTSGLDAQALFKIVHFLRRLTAKGQTILCTIHQPSTMLFEQLDCLLLLVRSGHTVYFGNLGTNVQSLNGYFKCNGAPKCSPTANPAEYILDVVRVMHVSENIQKKTNDHPKCI